MKAKIKFMRMYYKLPKKARNRLIMRAFTEPMNLDVVALEVRNDTAKSKVLLWELGYEDEA